MPVQFVGFVLGKIRKAEYRIREVVTQRVKLQVYENVRRSMVSSSILSAIFCSMDFIRFSKLVDFFIVEISAISPSAIANSPIQAR